mgnify:CR=1 FL=1
MARILTGVQSTGVPHLGNLLGAVLPAIEMANTPNNDSFLFIADLHALTQIKDADQIKANTYATAAAWLACGLDPKKTVFYRQSDVPQVTELTWHLNCFFPYSRLSLAHSFKDKADRMEDINAARISKIQFLLKINSENLFIQKRKNIKKINSFKFLNKTINSI